MTKQLIHNYRQNKGLEQSCVHRSARFLCIFPPLPTRCLLWFSLLGSQGSSSPGVTQTSQDFLKRPGTLACLSGGDSLCPGPPQTRPSTLSVSWRAGSATRKKATTTPVISAIYFHSLFFLS